MKEVLKKNKKKNNLVILTIEAVQNPYFVSDFHKIEHKIAFIVNMKTQSSYLPTTALFWCDGSHYLI